MIKILEYSADDTVTVIIPTYKRVDMLIRAIDSVINQTYQNIEIFVVIDGDDEASARAVEKKSDERIKIITFKA